MYLGHQTIVAACSASSSHGMAYDWLSFVFLHNSDVSGQAGLCEVASEVQQNSHP